MKKIYFLFVAATLAACSAESLENKMVTGIDANLEGKSSNKAAVQVAEEFVIPQRICVGVDAEFKINAPVGTNIQVQQYDDFIGEWVQVDHISKSTTNPHLTTLNFDSAGEYQLRYKSGSGGFSEGFTIIVNNCGCEESFSYVDNGDKTYTFTYVPAEALVDAELVFTFAQGAYVHGLNVWEDNGQTKNLLMDLDACTTYNWTVTLEAKCNGNSSNSNVWTDFKVNDVSKKADEEDKFVQACN